MSRALSGKIEDMGEQVKLGDQEIAKRHKAAYATVD